MGYRAYLMTCLHLTCIEKTKNTMKKTQVISSAVLASKKLQCMSSMIYHIGEITMHHLQRKGTGTTHIQGQIQIFFAPSLFIPALFP